jgi:hypothetical protein
VFRTARTWLPRLAIVCVLLPISAATSGCGFSFCAGSGCDSGKIYFGGDIQQSQGGGAISLVGKTDTFHLGQNVALLANLSESAGTTTLALEVTGKNLHKTVPYHIQNAKDNEIGTVFSPSNLSALGVTSPGTYTFRVLHGSKQLASGSMTEK